MRRPSDETLGRLEERLGYRFEARDLLVRALVHASAKTPHVQSNDRLEFLGDAVVGLIAGDYLFRNFPHLAEGAMSPTRAQVVSRASLATVARRLGLEHFVVVGKMFPCPEAIAPSVLSSAFEALIGAVYLDGGFEVAGRVALGHLEAGLRDAALEPGRTDFKSKLGQYAMKNLGGPPLYVLLSAVGPEHALTFEVAARIGEREWRASGRTKKAAEQEAARHALLDLGAEAPPETGGG